MLVLLLGVAVGCGGPEAYQGGDAGVLPVGTGGTGSLTGTAGTGSVPGTAGVFGAAGTTGAAGVFGAAGTSGQAGTTGAAGTTGVAGTTGAAGTKGAAGTTGAAGTSGGAGTSGAAGTSAAAGTSGAAGTTGTAGTGGAPVTGACAGKTHGLPAPPTIYTFEDGTLTAWYDYKDSTAAATFNHVAITTPGANGTSRAGRLSGSGFTGFGAGMGYGLACLDARGTQGISFWAKGTSGTDNVIALQVAIPASHAVADGGDCTAMCFDHPQKKVLLTTDWKQYRVTWSELAQVGFGKPASFQGIIMALNWVSQTGPALDFSVDEIALY